MLRQDGQEESLQLLIFVLDLETGSDAIASVQEGFTLGVLQNHVQKEADDVDGQVHRAHQEPENGRRPSGQWKYGAGNKCGEEDGPMTSDSCF